jgi:hypothetical protein
MSRHAYPRIGRATLQHKWLRIDPKNAPKCSVIGCREPAHFLVDIQLNGLHAENEQAQACPAHQTAVHALLTGLAKNQADLAAARKAKASKGSA